MSVIFRKEEERRRRRGRDENAFHGSFQEDRPNGWCFFLHPLIAILLIGSSKLTVPAALVYVLTLAVAVILIYFFHRTR